MCEVDTKLLEEHYETNWETESVYPENQETTHISPLKDESNLKNN
jgi:hypothetical protein